MKQILVAFICLSILLLSASCSLASFEIYYDGIFNGELSQKESGSVEGFNLGSGKVKTDFSLHTLGGRIYLFERLLIGAEAGAGSSEKTNIFLTS